MTFLDDAEGHLQAGDTRRARKTLERARTHALLTRNADELERVLELAERLAKVDRGRGTQRLVYATTQNLRFLQRTPPAAAPHAPTPSSLDLNRALASVDIAARNLETTIQRAITV